MTEKIVYKCDFCGKSYTTKYATRRHEIECFHNPDTQSCATCVYCSLMLFRDEYPRKCYIGELSNPPKSERQKLKTGCPKWIDMNVAEEVELLENRDGILDQLMTGSPCFLKTMGKLISESSPIITDNRMSGQEF